MSYHAPGRLLKMVRGKPVIVRTDKLLKKEPGAPGQEA
jgi:hypothetical protein